MKPYGQTREQASCEDNATRRNYSRSRSFARLKAADKKRLHRKARRTWREQS